MSIEGWARYYLFMFSFFADKIELLFCFSFIFGYYFSIQRTVVGTLKQFILDFIDLFIRLFRFCVRQVTV